MKIVFIGIGAESLSIEILSSILKRHGHQTSIAFDPQLMAGEAVTSERLAAKYDVTDAIVEQVLAEKPDLIGFSVFTFNYRRSLDLAQRIKRRNSRIPIIFGGIHTISAPEAVIQEDCVDVICVGEGDEALPEYVESLAKGDGRTNIQNLWFKKDGHVIRNLNRPLVHDLDSLPFPDKELYHGIYPGFVVNSYLTLTSRGCPFACTYCANNVIHKAYKGLGKTVRQRSPRHVVDELVWAKKTFHPREIAFMDDTFAQSMEWLSEFAKYYTEEVGLPYVVMTHPSFMTDEIVKLMVQSGCVFALFGLQSASEKIRRDILKRFETNKTVAETAERCHRYGLKFSIDHIFNIPTEGLPEYEEALQLYNQLRPSMINSYRLQYFPGTAIIDTAIQANMLKEDAVDKINHGLLSSAVVIGLGTQDSADPEVKCRTFQFFFTILPLLPKSFTETVIRRKWYLRNIKPPVVLNVALKFLNNITSGRAGIYIGVMKYMLYFTRWTRRLQRRYPSGPIQ